MKRGLKLVVTWLFIVSVFAGFIPGTLPVSSAAASNELIWPNPGAVNLTKTAEPTGTQGQWKVTLTVEGKNIQSTSDVVLVMDRSGSMDGSRMTKAKEAAKKFVDNLLIKDSKTRIAVVSFSKGVTTESDFKGTEGKESLKTKIDGISADGGTNIQAGLNRARTLLNGSQAQNKVIVLLSDGEPTYSYKAGKATAYNWPENKFNFALSDFNYGTILGSGQDYGLSEGFLGWGREIYTVNGFDVKNNGIGTISEAKLAKDSGIGIYSIGLEVGGSANAKYVLNNTQNKGYYESSSSELSKVFTELSSKISYAAQNAKVIDPMGAKFDKIDGPTVSQGTTSWDSKTETITWDIGNVVEGSPATMSYIVKMDNDADPNVLYPTNKVTTMSYTDVNGKSTSKNFIVPEVSFGKGSITVRGYSVNAAGQPINADGVVVEKPELAEQLYNNPFTQGGKPALDINKTYSVPAETVAGYQLTVGVDPTSVQLTTKVPTPTIWFGYVKAPYTLDVLHKVGDTVLKESKGIKKLQGEEVDYSSEEFAGYLFKDVVLSSNSGLTTEGGHVTGKMPNKNVTITFNYEAIAQNVTVKYLEKGSKKELIPATNEAGVTGKTITLTAAEIPGYTAEKASDSYKFTALKGQEYTFFYTAGEQKVTVKYLEKDTNKELATQTIVAGTTGKTITLNAATVSGYTAEKTSDSYTFSAVKGQEYTFFYTAGEQKVTVKYLDKNDHTNVLATETSIAGTTGKTITLEAAKVDGYTAEKASDSYTFKAGAGQEYTFYYTAGEQKVTVKYLDKNDHTNVLATETSVTGTTGKTVTLNAVTVAGYTAEKASDSYTFNAGKDQSYTFYYTAGEQKVTVKYLEEDTDRELATEAKEDGVTGETITLQAVSVPGYTAKVGSYNYTFSADEKQEHAFYYTANKQTVTVKHIDKATNTEIADPTTQNGVTDQTITLEAVTKSGYTANSDNKYDYTFTASEGQVATLFYTANEQTVTVKHVDKATNTEIADPTTQNGVTDQTITLEAVTKSGYTANSDNKYDYTFTASEGQVATLFYTANEQTVTVKHVDKATNTEIADPTTQNGVTDQTITLEAVTKSGYTANSDNKYDYTFTASEGQAATLFYTAKEQTVTVKHLDKDTNEEITEPTAQYGVKGEAITLQTVTIPGYTANSDNVYEYTFTADEVQVATLFYTKVAPNTERSVTVNYVDQLTQVALADPTTQSGKVGDMLKLQAGPITVADAVYTPTLFNFDYVITEALEQNYTFEYTTENSTDLQTLKVIYLERGTDFELGGTVITGREGAKISVVPERITVTDSVYSPELPIYTYTFTGEPDQELRIYYIKGELPDQYQQVTVKYQEQGTGKELAGSTIVRDIVGSTISLTAISIPGYTAVKSTDTFQVGDNEGQEYIFYYTKNAPVDPNPGTPSNPNTSTPSTTTPLPPAPPVVAPLPPAPPTLEKENHYNYINGYPDGTIKPENRISREEVAAIFYRLMDDETRSSYLKNDSSYGDVEGSRWSNKHIATMENAGIITGYPDGTFKPGRQITRAEFAAIASRFDNLDEQENTLFSDIKDHWAAKYIVSAANKGWIKGYPDGTFKPNQYITRAEAMAFINSVLNRKTRVPGIHEDAKAWPDNNIAKWYYTEVLEATNHHDYSRNEDGSETWTEVKSDRVYP